MIRLSLGRLASVGLTFFVVSIIVLVMMHAVPGGPFDGFDMPVSGAVKAKLNASHGLDRPLYVRYFNCMWGVLHVDFGVPFQSPGETVWQLLGRAWPPSLLLGGLGGIIGMPLGALAGDYGGRADWVVMRLIELFSVVPPLLAAMLLGALTQGGFATIELTAAMFGWVQVCLLVRAQVKAFREKEFVRAAQAMGASPWYIIRRHPIPHCISPIIVGFVLAIPLAIMLKASLGFLGIGVPPPTPIWGQMINTGMNFMYFYWHMAVFPTAALAITVLATTLFGDGLRDALDPTLKGR